MKTAVPRQTGTQIDGPDWNKRGIVGPEERKIIGPEWNKAGIVGPEERK